MEYGVFKKKWVVHSHLSSLEYAVFHLKTKLKTAVSCTKINIKYLNICSPEVRHRMSGVRVQAEDRRHRRHGHHLDYL